MGCDHKLIAGEPHLWGCKVGTELLWLQLDSVVVLVDCFLGTRTGPFRLAAFSHPTTQGDYSLCSDSPLSASLRLFCLN